MAYEVHAESEMTGRDGLPIIAKLSCGDDCYHCWIESRWDENDLIGWPAYMDPKTAKELVASANADCREFGVMHSDSLEEINSRLEKYCGDDSPAGFYWEDMSDSPAGY